MDCLSSLMEVKLDIREKRAEWLPLRVSFEVQNQCRIKSEKKCIINLKIVLFCFLTFLQSWTRCYVKIEAIKCFPCYMKITFHKNAKENDNGLVLRVNIPGLDIYPVSGNDDSSFLCVLWHSTNAITTEPTIKNNSSENPRKKSETIFFLFSYLFLFTLVFFVYLRERCVFCDRRHSQSLLPTCRRNSETAIGNKDLRCLKVTTVRWTW